MRLAPARWFATLRARRRAVLLALLPALALSATSATACIATMPAAATVEAESDAHAGHHGDSTEPHEAGRPSPPCPHCPLEAGDANAGHVLCSITDAQTGDATHAKDAAWHAPALVMDARLPAASIAPPLITTLRRLAAPPPASVTLNLRYCVLQI